MQQKTYKHTIANPTESFKPYFYSFGFTVPRPIYSRHQDGTLMCGENGEVVYANQETDWGLEATRAAYKKVYKLFWDLGMKICFTTKARQPLKQQNASYASFLPGLGRFHVHALIESDYKVSRWEINLIKQKIMELISADNRDSVYFRPAHDGALKYALYITENALKTVRPVNEKHIRLINKSQNTNLEELFPFKEYLQTSSGKGFALATLCRLAFITNRLFVS